jgi:hypothetical protein
MVDLPKRDAFLVAETADLAGDEAGLLHDGARMVMRVILTRTYSC